MFWGCSEALDLLSEYFNIFKNQDENAEQTNYENNSDKQEAKHESNKQFEKRINILLFGANDPRHIIKTMAKMYTHSSQGMIPILNFYLVDGCVEIAGRNLLLLGIALENPDILNLRTKVHLFMDIYGNALMRASSHNYLLVKAKSLLKIISDDDCLENLAPMFNFDRMKYRERDGLENVFDFWLSKETHNFNIGEYWNSRLRKQMGQRYDYREGQYDWDLNMVLKEREGQQICSQEYRYWRETGIAFTFPEFEYSKPNKTLSAGLMRNGDKFVHRGYVGDIQTGPFPAFGLKSSDERMIRSIHGENDYRSTDVTERNLLELFHELATQTLYEHDVSRSRKYGAVRFKMGQCLTHHDFDIENVKEYDKPWIFLDKVKINFLSSDDILSLQQNVSKQFSRFFDVAFIGYNYFHFLRDSFIDVLNHQSILIIETKFMSVARKEEIAEFEKKVFNYAKRNNFKDAVNYNALNSKNSILKFKSSFELSK